MGAVECRGLPGVDRLHVLTLRHRCTEVNEIMLMNTIAEASRLRCTTSTYQAGGPGLCPAKDKFEPWGSHTADWVLYTTRRR
jgi:hypothetical protein